VPGPDAGPSLERRGSAAQILLDFGVVVEQVVESRVAIDPESAVEVDNVTKPTLDELKGSASSEVDPDIREAGLDLGDPQRTGGEEALLTGSTLNAPPTLEAARSMARACAPENDREVSRPPSPGVQIDSIPSELRVARQWVNWRFAWDGARWTKVPYRSTGAKAKSTDPSTWSKFDDAISAYRRGGFDGVGFVVSDDDEFVGIDLDHCLDDGGKPEPWAAEIVEQLDSFTEVTPSGDGVRVWAKGRWNARHKTRVSRGTIEVYDRTRYFTVTGRHLKSAPAQIEERQDQLDALAAIHFASKPKPDPKPAPDVTRSIDDDELLRRARAAANGAKFTSLFDQGDWKAQGYTSQSEADLALCAMLAFWSGRDRARIDALFRCSALYRDKWDREDYCNSTIDHALEQADFHGPHHLQHVGAGVDPDESPPRHADSMEEPDEHDGIPRLFIETASEFLSREDPQLTFIIEGLIPEETTGLRHGDPRSGKSWAAAEECIAVATGTRAFGLFDVPKELPVWYLTQEDPERYVRARFKRLLAAREMGWPETLFLSVHKGIRLDDEAWHEAIIRMVEDRGIGLVYFDPARRFDRRADKGPSDVSEVTGFLRRLVVETGASVNVVHHNVKPIGERSRLSGAHLASGGDWFAASDCPVGFHALGGFGRAVATPRDFKFTIPPPAFRMTIDGGPEDPRVRVIGEWMDDKEERSDAKHEKVRLKVLDFLNTNPPASINQIKTAKGGRWEDIKATLLELLREGVVEKNPGPKGDVWSVRGGREGCP